MHDLSGGFRGLLVACALAVTVAPGVASADWPDELFGNLPLSTATGRQLRPVVTEDGVGGAFFAWADEDAGRIYGQKVNSTGALQWAVNGVRLGPNSGAQSSPSIAGDGTGGIFVAWADYGNAGVYAQRVSATGGLQWGSGVTICPYAPHSQGQPRIVSDGAGGAIVAWTDQRSGGPATYVQKLSAAGVVQWTANGVAVCTTNGHMDPALVADGSGGAIVAWADGGRSPTWEIYAQKVNSQGQLQWTTAGLVICAAAGDQYRTVIVPDTAGGAIIAWQDNRVGNWDVYAQRVSAAGVVQWTADGVGLCTATGTQYWVRLALDGAGGTIVSWMDDRSGNNDIYAQRVDPRGVPLWASQGVPVCAATGSQEIPAIVSDGGGGAVITWSDSRSGSPDIYAQRISDAGAPLWAANGVALSTAAGRQYWLASASDGNGGAIAVWEDERNVIVDVYAQAVDRFGYLGAAPPAIASVRDVPNDQGGRLKVSWLPSHRDADPEYGVGAYWVWRSVPPNKAATMIAGGAALATGKSLGDLSEPRVGDIFLEITGSKSIYWEYVGSTPATGDPGYSTVVATTSDSLPGSNLRTLVRVQARAVSGPAFWNSAADSGYSVDNLAPLAPAFIGSTHDAGVTDVRWRPNGEPDLAGYRLYRGATAGFVPGPGNFLSALAGIEYVDVGAPVGSYYKLTAVDVHGNASPWALLSPLEITGVGDAGVPAVTRLLGAQPNPFNPSTTIGFALARPERARLVVFDAAGRRVRMLLDERREPGSYQVRWDGRTDRGQAAASGVYFCRLDAGSVHQTSRLALVR